jgi:hypothetical protein
MIKILFSCFVLAVLIADGRAVTVLPFTEGFDSGASNWLNGGFQTPNYASSGGLFNSGYISTSATIDTTGFGPIVFRGNNSTSASDKAFVGDWLLAGVSEFSAYVWHNAPVALNFYARFDKGAGSAASSNNFLVAPSIWTQINILILDSLGTTGQIFQSYGAAGAGGFNTIFSDIKNVQIALGAAQDASTHGQTYTVGLDSVSIVPEPGTGMLLMLGLGLVASFRRFSRRSKNL